MNPSSNQANREELRQIRVISFDGDMTLWDFRKAMRQALDHTLRRLRERVPGEASAALSVDTMIEIRNQVAEDLAGARLRLEEIRLAAFVRTVEAVGCDDRDLADELNAIYRRRRLEGIELYPDVIPALDDLQSAYTLGLLSNGNTYPEQCGLPDRFAFVVFAQDVGIQKPAPEIFAIACRQAGCSPNEVLHVGDSLESDVQGANNVGSVSVWLNRDGRPNTTDIAPDYEIRSLMDLPGILDGGSVL